MFKVLPTKIFDTIWTPQSPRKNRLTKRQQVSPFYIKQKKHLICNQQPVGNTSLTVYPRNIQSVNIACCADRFGDELIKLFFFGNRPKLVQKKKTLKAQGLKAKQKAALRCARLPGRLRRVRLIFPKGQTAPI